MAKTSKNTDLVPKEALQQLKDLDAQLDSTTNSLKEMLVPVSEISNKLSTSAASYKDLVEAIKSLNIITDGTNTKLRQRATIEQKIKRLNDDLAQAYSDEAKELAKLNVQLRRQNELNKSLAKSNLENADSINAMRERLKRWTAIANRMGTSTVQFQKMSAAIKKLNDDILQQEAAMGNYRRNVGNYSSAFYMLQYNIQQVARELPSLTISASQFFLAISNNLPMLVDELKRAKDANKALREEGTKTVPVWKQLVKGIFSWQTALVVGITLLSAYGSEIVDWVKGLFKAEEALDAVAEAQKSLRDASIDGRKNAYEELTTLKLLYETAVNTSKSMEERTKAVDLLQKKYPSYLSNISKENILNGDASLAYNRLRDSIKEVAMNKAILNKMTENNNKLLELDSIYTDDELKNLDKLDKEQERLLKRANEYGYRDKTAQNLLNERYYIIREIEKIEKGKSKTYSEYKKERESILATNKVLEDKINILKTENDLITDPIKSDSNNVDNERQALLEYYQLVYKDRAEYYKAIVSDERLSYEDRQKALDKFTKLQLNSIKARKEAEIEALGDKGGANEIALIEAKANSEYKKIWTERANIWNNIEGKRSKDAISNYTKEYEAQVRALTGKKSDETGNLTEQYTSGIISKDDYERQKLEITRKYAEQDFAIEREYLNNVLGLTTLTDEERTKFTEQLGDAELKYKEWLYNEDVKSYEEAQKKKEEIDKEKAKVREDLLRSSFELAKALLQRDLENRLEKLDEESEANQEWRDEEAERIDRLEESGAISKEQADARKAAIDDQAEAREDEIEKKKVEAQRRMAIYEKAVSIANAIMSTKEAIAKTMETMGMPLAIPFMAMAAAAGAAQIAAIVATPLPQYAEGTEDHPGGLAIVGDGGKSEMVIANGKIFKTPSVDTLVELPRHAMVLPDFNMAAEKLPEMPRIDNSVKIDISKLEASSIENGKLLKSLVRRMEINAKNDIYEREFNRLRPAKR